MPRHVERDEPPSRRSIAGFRFRTRYKKFSLGSKCQSHARRERTKGIYPLPFSLRPLAKHHPVGDIYQQSSLKGGRERVKRASSRAVHPVMEKENAFRVSHCSRWGASRMKRNASAHSRRPGTSRRYSTSKLRKPARQTAVNKKRRRDARRNERRGLERGCLPSEERVRGGVRGRAGTGNETTLLGDGRGVHKSVCCLRNAP